MSGFNDIRIGAVRQDLLRTVPGCAVKQEGLACLRSLGGSATTRKLRVGTENSSLETPLALPRANLLHQLRVVADLVATGYLEREREGRRNVYHVKTHLPLRLPFQRDLDVKSLLAIMATPDEPSSTASVK